MTIIRIPIVLRLSSASSHCFFPLLFHLTCCSSNSALRSRQSFATGNNSLRAPVRGASNKIAFIMSIALQCCPMKSFRSVKSSFFFSDSEPIDCYRFGSVIFTGTNSRTTLTQNGDFSFSFLRRTMILEYKYLKKHCTVSVHSTVEWRYTQDMSHFLSNGKSIPIECYILLKCLLADVINYSTVIALPQTILLSRRSLVES